MGGLGKAGRGLLKWLRGGKSAQDLTGQNPTLVAGQQQRPPTLPVHYPTPPQGETPAPGDEVELEVELLRRFEDEGEIGRGGMSSVRRVRDTDLLRRVAMKVLDPDLAREPMHVQAFLEEAQITAQLDHPNLVPVHEMGIDPDGTRYFTMRLVRGRTLADWLSGREDLASPESLQESLGVLLKVCDALAFAHSRGVLHCDLKPANVMVGEFGEVYLMDWGLALLRPEQVAEAHKPLAVQVDRPAGAPTSRAENKVSGTPGYMSPEQAMGKWSQFDQRTDVFSLGAVLYHVLTGKAPFAGTSVRETLIHAATVTYQPPQLVSDQVIPPGLSRIIHKALQKEPADRYQSVLEFKKDVERFLHGGLHFPSRTFEAGEKILLEGDSGDTAYLIVEGRCRVMKSLDGVPTEIRVLEAGTVFGEAALVSARPRTATVEAIDSVTALVITREQLNDGLGSASWLGTIVLALAERFQDVDQELTRLREERARGGFYLNPP
jgi:eukaryotic-like serine/threonine-protein kinase